MAGEWPVISFAFSVYMKGEWMITHSATTKRSATMVLVYGLVKLAYKGKYT